MMRLQLATGFRLPNNCPVSMSSALSPSLLPLSSSSTIKHPPVVSCPNSFFRPESIFHPKPRLRVSYKPVTFLNRRSWAPPRLCCLNGGDSEPNSEADPSASSGSDSPAESRIDLKLPRRRLLIQFTCNSCGERTKRLINRLAYERGTVFVQCAGCLQHHKLVDNLGLIVEYDFRDDVS